MRSLLGLPACLCLLCAGTSCAGPSSVTEVWSGVAEFRKDAATNAMDAAVREQGRSEGVPMPAVFLHPNSEGEAVLRYTVELPAIAEGQRLIFSAWAGLSDGAGIDSKEHPFDGVRIGARVGEASLFRTLVTGFGWQQQVLDLARWAGQTVELCLVTDSGGKGNASYDWAQIGSPAIYLLSGNALEAGAAEGTAGIVFADCQNAADGATLTLSPEGAAPGLKVPIEGPGLVLREFGPAELGAAGSFTVRTEGRGVQGHPSVSLPAVSHHQGPQRRQCRVLR